MSFESLGKDAVVSVLDHLFAFENAAVATVSRFICRCSRDALDNVKVVCLRKELLPRRATPLQSAVQHRMFQKATKYIFVSTTPTVRKICSMFVLQEQVLYFAMPFDVGRGETRLLDMMVTMNVIVAFSPTYPTSLRNVFHPPGLVCAQVWRRFHLDTDFMRA